MVSNLRKRITKYDNRCDRASVSYLRSARNEVSDLGRTLQELAKRNRRREVRPSAADDQPAMEAWAFLRAQSFFLFQTCFHWMSRSSIVKCRLSNWEKLAEHSFSWSVAWFLLSRFCVSLSWLARIQNLPNSPGAAKPRCEIIVFCGSVRSAAVSKAPRTRRSWSRSPPGPRSPSQPRSLRGIDAGADFRKCSKWKRKNQTKYQSTAHSQRLWKYQNMTVFAHFPKKF